MKVICRLFVIISVLMVGKAVAVEFSEAMSEATRNTQTPAGRKYDEEFGASFERNVEVMGRCTEGAKLEELRPFYVVAKVGASRQIEEVIVSPETKVARCVRENMIMRGYPDPPAPHYWVSVHMTIR